MRYWGGWCPAGVRAKGWVRSGLGGTWPTARGRDGYCFRRRVTTRRVVCRTGPPNKMTIRALHGSRHRTGRPDFAGQVPSAKLARERQPARRDTFSPRTGLDLNVSGWPARHRLLQCSAEMVGHGEPKRPIVGGEGTEGGEVPAEAAVDREPKAAGDAEPSVSAAPVLPAEPTAAAGRRPTRKRAAKRGRSSRRAPNSKALRQQLLQAVMTAWEAELAARPPTGALPPLPYRPSDYAEAHAVTAAERAAIPARDVRKANVNAAKVVALALAVVPVLDQLRPALATLPAGVAMIDRIDTLARSFSYSDALARGALDPTSTDRWEPGSKRVFTPRQRLRNLLGRTIAARRSLNSEVRNLILQGKLPKVAVEGLKGGAGYYNAARDVLTLVTVLRDAPATVRAASSLGDAELEQYTQLAYELTNAHAQMSPRSETKLLAWDNRARAFTLLWHAYREAQRALTYILWGLLKVTDVLPTLMVGVGRKKASRRNGA